MVTPEKMKCPGKICTLSDLWTKGLGEGVGWLQKSQGDQDLHPSSSQAEGKDSPFNRWARGSAVRRPGISDMYKGAGPGMQMCQRALALPSNMPQKAADGVPLAIVRLPTLQRLVPHPAH